MKVGIITEYFFPTIGGIVENIYHMSREFLAIGHDLRIITSHKGPLPDIDPDIKKRIIYIGKTMPTFFNGTSGPVSIGIGLKKRVLRVLKDENFDILHLHSPLFPTLPLVFNAQATVPMVATYHTCTETTTYYRIMKKQLQALINRISGNVAVSDVCADDNKRFFNIDFDVIPNGVDTKWWKNSTNKIKEFDDGKINILFLGRPDKRNGLGTLIPAFAKLHKKLSNTRLIIVGEGFLLPYFKGLVTDDIRNDVIFEKTALEKRRDYMASSHIMCFLPEIASFGITVLEGMSAEISMVLSDIGPFRQLVKNGESALLVHPNDIDATANALERLAADENLRRRLASKAASSVAPYDWKIIANIYLQYFQSIIDGKRMSINYGGVSLCQRP